MNKSKRKRSCDHTPATIPTLTHNKTALKLAALCRELQREAGDRPFICPVNMAQQFLGLRFPEQANYLCTF